MKTLITLLTTLLLAASSPAAAPNLPMVGEQIVGTCYSGQYLPTSPATSPYYTPPTPMVAPNPAGFVVAHFGTTSANISGFIPAPNTPSVAWNPLDPPNSVGNHNENNPGLEWTRSRLGEVFGIALDDSSPPNIYVAASDVYNLFGASGSLNDTSAGVAMGPGGIYKLDANNGAITSSALPALAGGPGLGNLCFYRAQDTTPQFYVSNLEDGKIYRVTPALALIAGTGTPYDHGITGRATANLPTIPDNGAPGLTQYGRRIWGVKTFGNRLFYAVWWEDGRYPSQSNEIWSVDLDNSGNFVAGSAQLRITLPNYPGVTWSYPVASIDFSPAGAMFLAERSWQMNPISRTGNVFNGNPIYTGAFGPHFCRVHRYSLAGPTWVTTPSTTHRVAAGVGTGWTPTGDDGTSSAGGVAVNCDESIWATGDFFNGYNIPLPGQGYLYGAMRISAGGNAGPPAMHAGFIVDYDGAYGPSKTTIGAIATLRTCCATYAATNVNCPVLPGGAYTVTLNINNPTSAPITNFQFTAVPGNQLPPGATTVSPVPPTFTPNSPIPPGGSGSVTLSLPGVAPIGGNVCFLANVLDSHGDVLCSHTVCVTLPKCPCVVLTTSNLQCPACLGQPHTLNLTIQNIWSTPYTFFSMVPALPSELPPGATSVGPGPSGLQALAPLQPGNSVTVPVTLTGVPLAGGVFCFKVRFYNAQEQVECEEIVCLTFPACNPGSGMTLTQVGLVGCPTYLGGPFNFTFTVTNNQTTAVSGATLGACGPGNNFGVSQSTITFNTPLGPGQTSPPQTIGISGLNLGQTGCLCVQFLGLNNSPACSGTICFTLPAECAMAPCMTLDAVNIACPTGALGYTFNLNLTNNSGTAAGYYTLSPVPPGNLPPGAATGQPSPGGFNAFGPVAGNGGTATISNIQLPPGVAEGSNFCFLVSISATSEQPICSQMVCLTLPRCSCATVTASVTCVAPMPNRQVIFTVTNNTNAVGTPFNFASAAVIPAVGFSPSLMTPAPNPILPGGTGTFTTTFVGGNQPACVMLIFYNENKTRCCRIQFCPTWVNCGGPPRDLVHIGSYLVTDLDGYAATNAWITNTSATDNKYYGWRLMPADVPDCDATLSAAAFPVASGTTGLVPPGSSQGVSFSINGAALAAGSCAGYKICFSELSPFYTEPVCELSVVQRSRPGDPMLVANPTNRAIPVLAGDMDSIILNPSAAPMEFDLVLFDTGGKTTYTLHGPPWPTAPNEAVQRVSLAAGGIAPILLEANIAAAPGTPAVEPALVQVIWVRPCRGGTRGYDILGTQIHFRPGGTQPFVFPPDGIRVLPVSDVAFNRSPDFPTMHFTMPSEPGVEYHAFADPNLIHFGQTGGDRIWPYPGSRMIVSDDGTFLGVDGFMTLDLPGLPGATKEFFKVKSATPQFGPP